MNPGSRGNHAEFWLFQAIPSPLPSLSGQGSLGKGQGQGQGKRKGEDIAPNFLLSEIFQTTGLIFDRYTIFVNPEVGCLYNEI